ncbi:maltose acetyltransferase domain-containing protein [Nocardia sp. CA-107356]|uniref:maltose acetyltransferase domain-containing protein n=1 Tax=Nocardia sp. CA-107356 TaxID=3239972 RepID=UPI003D8F0802
MGEQKERMLRGELYRDSDPELVAERIRAQRLCDEFNRTGPEETERRGRSGKESCRDHR